MPPRPGKSQLYRRHGDDHPLPSWFPAAASSLARSTKFIKQQITQPTDAQLAARRSEIRPIRSLLPQNPAAINLIKYP